ncbi:DUF2357 domain-containing protein [uncultured Methanobrevibacter sp.]|uniref:DUF2357 domain-containing protein n=1 Tax=uncultured Methanobrevibacter sp. TaxID=253161 RepID=UPI0025D1178B|nr:DUF2357 domain-containing protein [uncultured Methanobrevibacter sp.]
MVEQSINIKIKTKEEVLGTLTISSNVNMQLDNKFKDIGSKKIKGIVFNNIEKDFALDTYTPIQYCVLPSYSTNIFLLEETEYTFSFIPSKFVNIGELKVFNYLSDHSHGKSNIRFIHLNNVWIANVNFRGFAGKTFVDIIYGDFKFSLMVEVRTKKLDYDNEYSQMIADLSEYSSGLLFNVNASLYQNHIFSKDLKSTLYEYFMLLEYLFRPQNLPAVCEYLSRNLYSLLENTFELVPTPLASNIGSSEIAELSSNPQYISETTEEYSIYDDENNHYALLMINEIKYINNIDVPENRFFKYFLEFIRDLIVKLYHENPNEKQVKLYLENYTNIINSVLSHRYFKDISRLDYIPLNSQVLQKKEGYREILQYYLMFEFGLKISFDDLTDNFRGFQKELSKIYEIWCYFELIDIVNRLTNSQCDFETFIDVENWSLSLDKINMLDYFNTLVLGENEVNLKLMYNYSFYHSDNYSNGELYSYSEQLDPDYTLVIECNGIIRLLHFDAKYKLKEGSYKSEDIQKMHTYKDGINDSIGAYVLYPSDNDAVIYNETDGSFGSVGAFCLKPRATNINKKEIRRFIFKIIKDAINEGLFGNDFS